MKKRSVIILIFLLALLNVNAQTNTIQVKSLHVAVFAPLYLDSAFEEDRYSYGKAFPKFVMGGLDFVQGCQMALDSLKMLNINITTQVFDTKADETNIAYLITNNKLDSIDIIIGSVKDTEINQLAGFAKSKNIPFISATTPNDAGITANPFFIITNATLRAHCEALYSYLIQKHGNSDIYLCRKKGGQEDKIADFLKAKNEVDGKPLLNIKTLNFTDDFLGLSQKLDSTKKTVIIGGSLNEEFAISLCNAAFDAKETYPIEMIGMPNWNTFSGLKKATFKDFEILFTSAYYNAKNDKFSKAIASAYAKKFKASASEMTYKGFEAMYLFTKLIAKYPNDFSSHLNEVSKQVFGEYNFMPVYVKKDNPIPDYFENKHLYFMKLVNGKVLKLADK